MKRNVESYEYNGTPTKKRKTGFATYMDDVNDSRKFAKNENNENTTNTAVAVEEEKKKQEKKEDRKDWWWREKKWLPNKRRKKCRVSTAASTRAYGRRNRKM
jgi:hypothetical protein